MNLLSERINAMSESATIAMSKKSRELAEQGVDVIGMTLGEPDFNTPDFIKDAAKKAVDDNFTTYMPVPGYLDLRQAIAKKFKRDNGLDYGVNDIVVSTGAKQTIANLIMSLVNPGEEVILPVPYWVSYRELVTLAEGKPKYVNSDVSSDFKITPAQLEEAITENTKLIIFSSPCNPSGSVYTKEELQGLAKVLEKNKHVITISDEIYEHIIFSGKHESLAQFSEIKENVVTVNGVSKGFAMTGWRIGYMGAPTAIAKACEKMQGQFTSGASSIAQKAALAAVSADPSVASEMREAFRGRRDLILSLVKEIPGLKCNVPQGAFYIFPDVSSYFGTSTGDYSILNATDLAMYLLNEAHVGVVTGEAFGDPKCIRISYACSDDKIKLAIGRIKEALAKLKVAVSY